MHYEKRFDKEDEAQNRADAMEAIKEYLGYDHFNKVNIAFREAIEAGLTRRIMRRQAGMFLGITGYPVEVWADELGLPPDTTEEGENDE